MPMNEQTLGSTNLTVNCTTLGCSFEFACDGGSEPLPQETPTTIVCQENGKWNYSNIYCEGLIFNNFSNIADGFLVFMMVRSIKHSTPSKYRL